MFMDVRGCSLRVVGVPVKILVKLHRMTRWEDLNLRRGLFSPAGWRLCGGVERGQCDFCPFLSHAVDEGRMVLLPVLLSFDGGRLVAQAF